MAYSLSIREEELKNRVAADWFSSFDGTRILGNLDFCISTSVMDEPWSFLWAEAKAGNKEDIAASFTQLVITLGKEKPQEKRLPPAFLGAFDAEKIAFMPYFQVIDLFHLRDFNWQVTPSNHQTPEFQAMLPRVRAKLDTGMTLFRFGQDDDALRAFITANFKVGRSDTSRMEITRNNFVSIYYHWRQNVMPSISVKWENATRVGLMDADFYLADILSKDNATLREKLRVLLKSDHYEFDRSIDELMGTTSVRSASFRDGGTAHAQFWNRYTRPPRREFWDYIVERRELLMPQDVRERKGSYFTPQCWVELSQKYLADTLGENWQDEYYVWDCAAGTGNLLHGLVDKYRIFASTLDQADVDVMKDRIAHGANLLEKHVFQFDFLNDALDGPKVPKALKTILKDTEKRKKLLIYINPPYAEAANRRTVAGTGENRTGVAVNMSAYTRFFNEIGIAGRELYAQFLIRIAREIPGCQLAQFSKLKVIQASNFKKFREAFAAQLKNLFIVPAATFDNVSGKFPIGFFIWDTGQKNTMDGISADIYDDNGNYCGKKNIFSYREDTETINDWIIATRNRKPECRIGYLSAKGYDFQNQNYIYIVNDKTQLPHPRGTWITNKNLSEIAVYLAVRHVIPATWLNDRDQFLHPKESWQTDSAFQTDCLAWALFNNNIQTAHGVNNWIPFTEPEVDAREAFESHFMTDYMAGRIRGETTAADGTSQNTLPGASAQSSIPAAPLDFSPEAQAVFDAGRAVWAYYHARPDASPNAALYDIKAYFQGRDAKGKLKKSSTDAGYNDRMKKLRNALKILAATIEPKVYEHGFLLR